MLGRSELVAQLGARRRHVSMFFVALALSGVSCRVPHFGFGGEGGAAGQGPNQEVCGNGKDDDGDSKIDCDDSDCACPDAGKETD
ncbi:MAG: hypothetical protein JW940_01140, partial [Polyangiaceae bacterium]|nr:hypothetical protein [Polyangiaceae bacterium]